MSYFQGVQQRIGIFEMIQNGVISSESGNRRTMFVPSGCEEG
jgi:hypothetical protein